MCTEEGHEGGHHQQREAEEEDGVYPYRHGDGTGLEVRLVPVTARDPSLGSPSLGDEDDEGRDARATTKETKTRRWEPSDNEQRRENSRAWT